MLKSALATGTAALSLPTLGQAQANEPEFLPSASPRRVDPRDPLDS